MGTFKTFKKIAFDEGLRIKTLSAHLGHDFAEFCKNETDTGAALDAWAAERGYSVERNDKSVQVVWKVDDLTFKARAAI